MHSYFIYNDFSACFCDTIFIYYIINNFIINFYLLYNLMEIFNTDDNSEILKINIKVTH